ncbi:MAG TPA: ornithine carbamoyltransferase [Thermoanaerobaculia bacterium]|nr:ornithine carbamoyltransferase [Thermoanaerobaculia bacterium]HQR66804.1 ornithine carbamoyltransferase [Thermoanaerobaculia bacterium]
MPVNLKNRSLLDVTDLAAAEFRFLLDLAAELKRAKRAGLERPRLAGKNLCIVFEKTSTRTRCAFEVAAYDQGMGVTYLDPAGSQIGHKESMKDTARVLGRMYDAIEYRGFSQESVEVLAKHAGVPVYNGLTDASHPTQMLADLLTMEEHVDKPLRKVTFAFLGDARNNVAASLLLSGALMGMDVRLCGPRALFPEEAVVERARALAAASGASIAVTDDPKKGVKGCDVLYTDVWVSLGEPAEKWAERIRLLKKYQVNAKLMAATGNPRVKFLHCLPAFHNRETTKGEELFRTYGLDGLEVTDEVFESPASVVFDQAENRMHTIKALLVATLA